MIHQIRGVEINSRHITTPERVMRDDINLYRADWFLLFSIQQFPPIQLTALIRNVNISVLREHLQLSRFVSSTNNIMKIIVLLLLCADVILSESGPGTSIRYVDVNTEYGIVRGTTDTLRMVEDVYDTPNQCNGECKHFKQVSINSFLGIPFAMPPLGQLRFEVCIIIIIITNFALK